MSGTSLELDRQKRMGEFLQVVTLVGCYVGG